MSIDKSSVLWDTRFLDMAKLIASWSKQKTTKVGAVIVDHKHRVVSLGFNGYPTGIKDDYNVSREEKLRRIVHAEENALLFSYRDLNGFTMYITHPPCARCAAKIIQSGIRRVVCLRPSEDFLTRWDLDVKTAYDMFNQIGIFVEYY